MSKWCAHCDEYTHCTEDCSRTRPLPNINKIYGKMGVRPRNKGEEAMSPFTALQRGVRGGPVLELIRATADRLNLDTQDRRYWAVNHAPRLVRRNGLWMIANMEEAMTNGDWFDKAWLWCRRQNFEAPSVP